MSDPIDEDWNEEEWLKYLQQRTLDEVSERYNLGTKRYGDMWTDANPEYLQRRAEEEWYAYRRAVEHSNSIEEAIEALADLNNFALFYLARRVAMEGGPDG